MPKSEFLPLLAFVLGENLNPCSVPRNEITLEMCRQVYAKDRNEFKAHCLEVEEYMKMCFSDEKNICLYV